MAINLIPPQLKKEKRLGKNLNLVFIGLSVVFLMLIITTGTIYSADFLVKKDLKDIENKVNEQIFTLSKYKDIEENVEIVNSKLEKIDSKYNDRILWSNILTELTNTTPENLQIKTLSVSSDNGNIALTGYAETRRDIAKLKEKMESSKYFKNVTFTTSVHKSDTNNFSYNLSSELEEIK